MFFGWVFVTVIVFTLGRPLDLLPLLGALVPGLPVYALLTASIVFLVPRVSAAAARAPNRAGLARPSARCRRPAVLRADADLVREARRGRRRGP